MNIKKEAAELFSKSLPLVYAVEEVASDTSSLKCMLGRDLVHDVCNWSQLKKEDTGRPYNGHNLSRVSFFVKKSQTDEPQHLGSASSFVEFTGSVAFLAHRLLAFEEDKSNRSVGDLVAVAALFYSGTIVGKDEDYAEKIIKSIENSTMFQATAAGLLILS